MAKKDARFYNTLQYLILCIGPTFVFETGLNWWAKIAAFVFSMGIVMVLMDIRALLLDPKREREELGDGEKF